MVSEKKSSGPELEPIQLWRFIKFRPPPSQHFANTPRVGLMVILCRSMLKRYQDEPRRVAQLFWHPSFSHREIMPPPGSIPSQPNENSRCQSSTFIVYPYPASLACGFFCTKRKTFRWQNDLHAEHNGKPLTIGVTMTGTM